MTAARIYRGGAWADSSRTARVYRSGAWVEYAPGSSTVDENFTFANPVTADWADNNTNVGVRFRVTTNGSWIGNRFWRVATAQTGESVFGVNDTAGVVIAPATAIGSATVGGYVTQLFSAPVAITPGVSYIAGYHTNRYGFTRVTDGATVPFTTTRLFTPGANMGETAVFVFGTAGATHPWSASPNFHYHVSPVVRFTV